MDWIPPVSTAALIGAALWLARNLIATRLTASVRYEFDQKLEALRSQLRQSEESFKADLRAKEHQIATLQSGALSGLASRQAAVDKRRLEAIDQLWSAAIDLGPAKVASTWMSVMKFEPVSKEAAKNPQFRAFFEMLGNPADKMAGVAERAAKARPYVSPIAWALYSAYQSIVGLAAVRLLAIQKGLDKPDLFNDDAVNKLVKVALPHHAKWVDEHAAQYGAKIHHHLLEELETRLLLEIEHMLQGEASDKAAVEQAGAIMREVERVRQQQGSIPVGSAPST